MINIPSSTTVFLTSPIKVGCTTCDTQITYEGAQGYYAGPTIRCGKCNNILLATTYIAPLFMGPFTTITGASYTGTACMPSVPFETITLGESHAITDFGNSHSRTTTSDTGIVSFKIVKPSE